MDASARETPSRPSPSYLDWLARAFVVSLAVHILAFGGYRAAKQFGWLQNIHLPAWLVRAQQKLAAVPPAKKLFPPVEQEPPLLFVEVNPAHSTAAPPKKAKYYSDKSSRAANPEIAEADTPKISGAQAFVPKTEDAPRAQAKPQPLQPTSAPAESNEEPEAKLKPAHTPGDLAFAKPTQQLRPSDGQDDAERPKPKPRTLAEAEARQAASLMPGEKMKQDGGVRVRAFSTLDVSATPFGAYDAAIIAAIQNRWYMLIDGQPLTHASGKVVLRFHLNYDGSVTEMTVLETTVSGLLAAMCQRAVIDPAPYGVWPADMRRMIGANFRDVTFTFYYY